jgi:hypothetical protein
MAILSKPSPAAQTSLIYITIGALTDVWSAIWYAYLRHNPPAADSTWYWCYGFFLSGLALLIIGLAVGRIGRSARHAELPPEETTPVVVKAEPNAAARAPLIAGVNPAMPVNPPAVPIAAGQPKTIVTTAPVATALPQR